MNELSPVASPCVKVCVLDDEGRHCIGCFRTLDEIGLWSRLSNPERADVVADLSRRRARFEAQGSARWIAQTCSRCAVQFQCGVRDPMKPCWCVSYPALAPTSADATCLCPACLAAATLA